MSFRHFGLVISLLAASATARVPVGAFATWAAFCDGPRKCFAISQPAERSDQPFLSIAVLGATPLVQVHVGHALRAAMLRIGDLRFDLAVSGENARADRRTSLRIVAALREGDTATLVATGVNGGRFRHHYALAGAPSAIDAAAVAAGR